MTSELEKKIPDIRQRMAEETEYSLKREGLKAGIVEPWEDGYRTRDVPNSFEWWYFDSTFDDGSNTVAVFSTRPQNDLKGPLKPLLLLIMNLPDGRREKLHFNFEPGEFQAESGGCDVKMKDNFVKGGLERYELHARIESYGADLVFTREVPSWRPDSGISYSGREKEKYFGWVVPIPYGSVEGTITFDGEERKVRGSCYHDHNWGNISMGKAIDHWYWGRAHVGDFTIIFVEMVTSHVIGLGSLKLHTLMLMKGNQLLTDDGLPLVLQTNDFREGPGGRSYPEKLDWSWEQDSERVTLTIRNPEMIESLDLIEDKPGWERAIMHLVENPRYYNFHADLELSVDMKGIKTTVNGKALYELMMPK